MAISIGHRCGETTETLTNVRAGCTVRLRLRLTDGGVALDWTDPLVSFGDVCVWSQARQGIIARPGFSFDEDDPTLLDVVHTTSTSDLPGPHKLLVTVRYNGWTAVHTVLAYNLVNNLYGGGASLSAVEGYAEEEGPVDITLALHEIDTTYLQCLIDALVRLRKDENERICTLETLSEGLRADVDANAKDIAANTDSINALAQKEAADVEDLQGQIDAICDIPVETVEGIWEETVKS